MSVVAKVQEQFQVVCRASQFTLRGCNQGKLNALRTPLRKPSQRPHATTRTGSTGARFTNPADSPRPETSETTLSGAYHDPPQPTAPTWNGHGPAWPLKRELGRPVQGCLDSEHPSARSLQSEAQARTALEGRSRSWGCPLVKDSRTATMALPCGPTATAVCWAMTTKLPRQLPRSAVGRSGRRWRKPVPSHHHGPNQSLPP